MTDLIRRLRALRVPTAFWPSTLLALGAFALASPDPPEGFPLLAAAPHGLILVAIGLELIASSFWMWSRLAADRDEQLMRWGWLRRPAMALWLAVMLHAALPPPRAFPTPDVDSTPVLVAPPSAAERDPLAPLRALEALAVLWAGLELLAALPLSRPYPDLTGPAPGQGPWQTALLPSAGFLVLLRLAPLWSAGPLVREVATLVLLFSAALAVLRAYSRRAWTASLRWLATYDSLLGALLLATNAVPPAVALLLWTGACGGRLMALAAEMRGATTRRGPDLVRLWRLAGWMAGASLAWPLLVVVGFTGGRFHPVEFIVLAAPVFLASSLGLRRIVEAPERRALARRDPARALSVLGAITTLASGPLALFLAWWQGFEASWPSGAVALLPAVLGAWPRAPRLVAGVEPAAAAGTSARDFAISAFRAVTAFEKALADAVGGVARAVGAPARDLHTGDAQEYLLFLVGVAVLALILPLLR